MMNLGLTKHYNDQDLGFRCTKTKIVSKNKIRSLIANCENYTIREMQKLYHLRAKRLINCTF